MDTMLESFCNNLGNHGTPGILALLAILAVCIYILSKGADWLVEGSAQLAYRLGIPKIIVGATVVSIGTTCPEAAVSVMSAIDGKPGMALGNAIGSVICDTGLIFGIGCLMTRLPLDRFILNRHGWLQFGSAILLVVLIGISWIITGGNPTISRCMGIFLLALLVAYMVISVRWAKAHPNLENEITAATHSVLLCIIMMIAGLAFVVLSSKVLIADTTTICHLLHIPQAVIAGTVVAFGTSLPELVTALTSIKKGHPELLIGNVIGADILNILFVIGASASATSLTVEPIVLYLHIPAMILILLLFRIFIATNKTSFKRACGIPLLLIYVTYLVAAYVVGYAPE